MNALTSLLKVGGNWAVSHIAQIETGVGIAVALAAAIKGVKETPKAMKKIEEKKEEKHVEKLTVAETVEATWKCFLPAIIMFILAIALIIEGQRESTRRAAAFASAYTVSQQLIQEYDNAAKELVGEKKATEIRDQAAIQQMQKNPPVANTVIVTGKGKQLCCDLISQHYFYSNAEQIRQAIAELNKQYVEGMVESVSLREYYYQINLREGIDMAISDELTWIRDDGSIEPVFTSMLGTGDFEDIPILGVSFRVLPTVHKDVWNH